MSRLIRSLHSLSIRIPSTRSILYRLSSTSTPFSGAGPTSSTPGKASTIVPFIDGIHDVAGTLVDVELDSWQTVQRLKAAGLTVGQAEDLSTVNEVFDNLQASYSAALSRDSVEIRTLNDKSTSELSRLLDTLKDALNASKTDLAIALNSFKADSLEETQRGGMRLHQEEGRLTVRMGAFKTATENVKLRAISLFSVVLCAACVVVAAKAKTPKNKKKGSEQRHDVSEEVLV